MKNNIIRNINNNSVNVKNNITWFFPMNIESFSMIECLSYNSGIIDYSTELNNINIKDEVYVYATKPYKAIIAKFQVEEILNNKNAIDESQFIKNVDKVKDKKYYVRLRLVKEYMSKKKYLELDVLIENGLKTVQSQHRINEQLNNYLEKI